jgi:hypothetical protein
MQHPSRPDSYKPGPENGVQVNLIWRDIGDRCFIDDTCPEAVS